MGVQEFISDFFSIIISKSGFVPLLINFNHAAVIAGLPEHHNDPFDRLLLSQAKYAKLPIITNDSAMAKYKIEKVW